jgi:hypothetical protein
MNIAFSALNTERASCPFCCNRIDPETGEYAMSPTSIADVAKAVLPPTDFEGHKE